MNNVIDVLNELRNRIDSIEKKTGRNLYYDKLVFEEDILPTLQKAKDEVNLYKRKLFASFIAACIHPDNIDCSNKQIYFSYLEDLDYLSVCILNNLNSFHTEWQLIEKLDCNYNIETIRVHLWNLTSHDLVNEISGEEYEKLFLKRCGNIRARHPERVTLYKRSNLGNEMLSFILKGLPQ